ncbi:MAG: DUF222 domain-containing protein [Actinomycetota bacterium]
MFDTMVDEMIGTAAASQMRGIPSGLDEMEPGPFLAIVLSGIDPDTLSGFDRITVIRARTRLVSHYAAELYGDMAGLVDSFRHEEGCDRQSAAEGAAYELRAALRLTRRAADVELSFALDLRDRLPRVLDALSKGLIDQRRARTIVWQTTHLDDEEARAVVDRIIDQAPSLTTGQLMARIRKLCTEVDPGAALQRYRESIADRRVIMDPTEAGTANLMGFDLPPHKVSAARHRINELAKTLRGPGEARTMDQLRADVYLDLLCGEHNAGRGGVVDIRVDLNTLVELNDHPGDLAGYGPIVSDITRNVVDDNHDAEWRYTITNNGKPVAVGTTRRRPNRGQKRLIEAAHPTCVFPGCRIPATQCDLDHTTAWADGGPTDTENLAPLCRHDHRLKHEAGWTYKILPNGDTEWTSPLDHTYTTRGRSP